MRSDEALNARYKYKAATAYTDGLQITASQQLVDLCFLKADDLAGFIDTDDKRFHSFATPRFPLERERATKEMTESE
jgi:hypothetical protein